MKLSCAISKEELAVSLRKADDLTILGIGAGYINVSQEVLNSLYSDAQATSAELRKQVVVGVNLLKMQKEMNLKIIDAVK
jgi:hypothetical protein